MDQYRQYDQSYQQNRRPPLVPPPVIQPHSTQNQYQQSQQRPSIYNQQNQFQGSRPISQPQHQYPIPSVQQHHQFQPQQTQLPRPQASQNQQPLNQHQQYVQQFQQLQQQPQAQIPQQQQQAQIQQQPQVQQLQQQPQVQQQQQQASFPQLATYRGPQIPPYQVLVQNTVKPLTQNQVEANLKQQANAAQQLQNKQNEANKIKDGKTQNKEEGGKPKKKGLPRQGGGDKWFDPTLDEWPENDFRVFVGDLGNEVNDDGLTRAFQKYRTFQKAKVVKDKRTGKTKGYGFLSFGDVDDYVLAIKEMNGKYIGNRPCKLVKSSWRDRMDEERMQKMNRKRKSNHLL